MMPNNSWVLRSTTLSFSSTPILMGIVNVTPDSFSDGGRFGKQRLFVPNLPSNPEQTSVLPTTQKIFEVDHEAVVHYALELAAQGAQILDIGGESTRPGSDPVSEEEELQRVLPVVEKLAAKTDVPLSVDTTRASVAQAALEAGAQIINDISGGTFSPEIWNVVRKTGAAYCLTHLQGTPKDMQQNPSYTNVVQDVCDWLKTRLDALIRSGVPQSKICLDPGIGFGKTFEQNLELLRNLSIFQSLGCPLLIGHSRKRFLRHIAAESLSPLRSKKNSESLFKDDEAVSKKSDPALESTELPLEMLDALTALTTSLLASRGKDLVQIFRVHNVFLNRLALNLPSFFEP